MRATFFAALAVTLAAGAALSATSSERDPTQPDESVADGVPTAEGASTAAPGLAQGLRLTVPAHEPLLRPASRLLPAEVPRGKVRAHAYQYVSRVFHRPSARPAAVGFVRRGVVLQADGRQRGQGCDRGFWYRLSGAPGYVCSRDGFALSREALEPPQRQPRPDVDAAMPYRYGKAKTVDVLRYYELPSPQEEAQAQAALEQKERLPEVVSERLDGIYLLALDREEGEGDRRFFRTVRGRYVRVQDVEPRPRPTMRGELLEGAADLPIAFIYGEQDAPLKQQGPAGIATVGSAVKPARCKVARQERWNGVSMVVRADGVAVERQRARLASKRPRPEAVGPNDKWIHVDLDEQSLVAYEGDRPVFATLVSSGKGAEFATPKGLYQIREKHITTTMNGPDPDAGYYEVEEVPWTLFYYDSYALHGAYWHNEFGNTRSHGCTNISPVDARWLFYWTDDELPQGWHALRKLRSSWVYITRDQPPQ